MAKQAKNRKPEAASDQIVTVPNELEIRYLHQKLDHFLKKEWQTLLEIQEIQIDLMNELSGKKTPGS